MSPTALMGLVGPPGITGELEQAVEFAMAGDDAGLPGTPENLLRILRGIPQYKGGEVRYLVAGGWAIELLTGVQREHKDLDFIALDGKTNILGTDMFESENYAFVLSVPPEVVRELHTRKVFWDYGDIDVYVASPEFLYVSKVVEPMRQKDVEDVDSLRTTFQLDERKCRELEKYTLRS